MSATGPTPSQPPTSGPKRIYRSRDERMIAGVCGGIATYFNIDPTLVRILTVLLAFAGGSGLVAYLVAWLIVPEEPVDWSGPARM